MSASRYTRIFFDKQSTAWKPDENSVEMYLVVYCEKASDC